MGDGFVGRHLFTGLEAAQRADDGSGSGGGGLVLVILIGVGLFWWFRSGNGTTLQLRPQSKRDAVIAEFRRELEEDGIVPVCMASVEVPVPRLTAEETTESWEFRVLALGRGQLMCSVDGAGYESTSLSSIEVSRFESNVLHLRTTGNSVLRYRSGPPVDGVGDLTQLARALRVAREGDAPVVDRQVASELTALYVLVQAGALDANDWAQAKTHFLGRPESLAEAAARELSGLYQLFLAGALTEGEWRLKRWDVLTRRR